MSTIRIDSILKGLGVDVKNERQATKIALREQILKSITFQSDPLHIPIVKGLPKLSTSSIIKINDDIVNSLGGEHSGKDVVKKLLKRRFLWSVSSETLRFNNFDESSKFSTGSSEVNDSESRKINEEDGARVLEIKAVSFPKRKVAKLSFGEAEKLVKCYIPTPEMTSIRNKNRNNFGIQLRDPQSYSYESSSNEINIQHLVTDALQEKARKSLNSAVDYKPALVKLESNYDNLNVLPLLSKKSLTQSTSYQGKKTAEKNRHGNTKGTEEKSKSSKNIVRTKFVSTISRSNVISCPICSREISYSRIAVF